MNEVTRSGRALIATAVVTAAAALPFILQLVGLAS